MNTPITLNKGEVKMEIYKGDPNNNDFIQSRAKVMTGYSNPNELPFPEQDFVSTAWENYYNGFAAGYKAAQATSGAGA